MEDNISFVADAVHVQPYVIRLQEGVRRRETAYTEKKAIDRKVSAMLKAGVIRESNSPWSSPIQLVPKKDSSTRFCIDYKVLNSKVIFDAFPLPLIADLVNSLHGATIFSTLDLKCGYWKLPLSEESKACTAFSTSDGHYEFNVLPFGISVALAVFERTMTRLFKGLTPSMSGSTWTTLSFSRRPRRIITVIFRK